MKFQAALLGLLLLVLSVSQVTAQGTLPGLSISVKLPSEMTEAGSIICSHEAGYSLCERAYDPNMFAVVSSNPTVYLASEDTTPVTTSGEAEVRVSATAGPIKLGDPLTSSEIPGVAQKAEKSGYVLGTALADFTPSSSDEVGLIPVAINIRPMAMTQMAGGNLLELIQSGVDAAYLTPLASLRYILAGVLSLASFFLGFGYFGRIAKSGIEAIGRNPLASRTIELGIAFNVFLAVAIMVAGLVISYIILTI